MFCQYSRGGETKRAKELRERERRHLGMTTGKDKVPTPSSKYTNHSYSFISRKKKIKRGNDTCHSPQMSSINKAVDTSR
jgi:hypothetical protein